MPTKNQIISSLYESKEFNEAIGKMDPDHLRDDLKQEVMVILLQTDDERILELYESNGLKFYTVRIILNLIQSKTSPFYKKYRQSTQEYSEHCAPVAVESVVPDSEVRILRELREDRAMAMIEELYWYDREIVKVYLRVGNYRDVGKETNIAWESCYSTIQKVIKKIRQHIAAESTQQ